MTSRDDLAKRREAEAERIAISLARQKGERRASEDRRKENLPVETERRLESNRRNSSERRSGTDRRNN